ncbi:MAG TPA: hypothetical protein VG602_01390, partial [Actinomycetota bacterium]|nr:hypothetical protein [Actinomycetota bacterium]
LEEDARAAKARAGPLRGTPHLKAKIREASEYMAAMREVVPIRTDLEVDMVVGIRNDARLDTLAKRWGLTGPVKRLRAVLDLPRAKGGTRRAGRGLTKDAVSRTERTRRD